MIGFLIRTTAWSMLVSLSIDIIEDPVKPLMQVTG